MRKLSCVYILRRVAVGALCTGIVIMMNAGCAKAILSEMKNEEV